MAKKKKQNRKNGACKKCGTDLTISNNAYRKYFVTGHLDEDGVFEEDDSLDGMDGLFCVNCDTDNE